MTAVEYRKIDIDSAMPELDEVVELAKTTPRFRGLEDVHAIGRVVASRGGVLAGAFVGTELVGVAMRSSGKSADMLDTLAVREDHRRRGIGSSLLREMQEGAAVAGHVLEVGYEDVRGAPEFFAQIGVVAPPKGNDSLVIPPLPAREA